MSRYLLSLAALALLQGCPLLGQISRATIQGTVTDSQQSVIQNVAIRIVQTETNTAYSTATNESGYYVMPGIPVGNYTVSAEQPGFKRGLRSGIVLQVDDRARVDFQLEVGAVAESVEVVGDALSVDTS